MTENVTNKAGTVTDPRPYLATPKTSMKIIRKDWPKVREIFVKGNRYFSVDMRRKNFPGQKRKSFNDKETALEFARAQALLVERSGFDAVLKSQLDPKFAMWAEKAAFHGKTLDELFILGLNECGKLAAAKESPYIAALFSEWIEDRRDDKLEPLRAKSFTNLQTYANTFKRDFGMMKIAEFTQEQIEQYLHDKDVGNKQRLNLKNYLGQFFNWAIVKKYCKENPCALIKIRVEQNGGPKFFTVAQCQEIMKLTLTEEFRNVSNYFALCLFAGIRPEETEKLTWKNVNKTTHEITVPASISKTKKDRLFKMSPVLADWILTNKAEKPLIPSSIKLDKRNLFAALSFPWVQDGLRHTFATFHYAKHKNLETLRHEMGNSPDVIEKFYKGIIADSEVSSFWNMTPLSLGGPAETLKDYIA